MTSERVLRAIRGTFGLDENDNSQDEKINAWDAERKFAAICQWEFGSSNWAQTILGWLEGCGYEIKEKNNDRSYKYR